MTKSRSLSMAQRAQQAQKKKAQLPKQRKQPATAIAANLKRYRLARLDELLAEAKTTLCQALDQLPEKAPRVVFLSFSDGTERAQVVHVRHTTTAQVWQALQQILVKQRLAGRKVRFLRVDWVNAARTCRWQQVQARLHETRRNYFRYGISLDAHFHHPLLEQELNANAMLYGGNKVNHACFNAGNVLRYTRTRFGKALPEPAPDQPVVVFTTAALLLQAEQAPTMINTYTGGSEGRDTGRRWIPELEAPLVQNLIGQSSQFLAEQVNDSGRFVYGLHPCFDREINTYNTLRHASTTYAMLEAWEVTGKPELKKAIDRALKYLASELIRVYHDVSGQTLAYLVEENGEIKLGGNAVCLLALVKYTELTGDERYLPLLEQLALGIVQMQNPETGQLVHVLNANDLSLKEVFRIIYYDGEAAFGLMRLYGLTGDERWLNAVVKAFDYFIAKKHWQVHDHWLSYCVNELTLYRPEQRYYQFGIQNVAGHLDFVIERITTFPTLLELMMAAHKMILRLQNSEEHRQLLDQLDLDKFYYALETRAGYLLNGFFWPEFAIYFKNPQRILGSFFIRHHSFRVRIDDVEHYLSGFVAYLQHYLPQPYQPAIRRTEHPRLNAAPPKEQVSPLHWLTSPRKEVQTADDAELKAQAMGWNRWHVAQATSGQWLSVPSGDWQATGLSFTALSLQPGHMVVVREGEGSRGVPVERLARLPHEPSALIFEGTKPQGLPAGIPCYQVRSRSDAILDFGRYARQRFKGRVVGVTGSAGKTSSVKLLQTLLSHWGKTGASRLSGNLPHGVAWNLASMDWEAPFQVVEMAIGRMSVNSGLAKPDVAVFLNVGPAHLEYHKTTEQVAIKKSRIFDAMEPGKHAVINRDMNEWPIVRDAAKRKKLKLLTFGTHPDSDIRWLTPSALVPSTGATVQVGDQQLTLPLGGQGAHVVMNVLAAFGVMVAWELPFQEIIATLSKLEPPEGRGQEWRQSFGSKTVTFVDDAYNANPLSMEAMLAQVAERSVPGRKHLLLGDMLELGEESGVYHRALVPSICAAGAESVILVGEQMQALAPALESRINTVLLPENNEQARLQLTEILQLGDLLVAKGSNKFKLSDVLKSMAKLSYLVVDDAGRQLIAHQSELPFRPGSLVKLLTAMVVLDHVDDLSLLLTVEPGDLVGGSGANLQTDDQLSVLDALHNLLIPSSNRSAQLLARTTGLDILQRQGGGGDPLALFVAAMNRKAQQLGAAASTFSNPSGLNQRDMWSTASDIMLISQAALGYPLIADIVGKEMHDIAITGQQPRTLTVTTRLKAIELPDTIEIVSGKTGTLVGAAENLMVNARGQGGSVLAVLMQQGGDRWYLMAELLKKTL
ncbi:MAG: Mur ligase middle domain-containing protein [Halomonas sp. 54_146]|nr:MULTISPECIES: Mur ligase family protein [unclassified Halomonas]KUJ88405.1 MAG: Mur ligase middle domain-containing protein [Halomonas sp. 54_146]